MVMLLLLLYLLPLPYAQLSEGEGSAYGMEVTRPYPIIVKASHGLGWLLVAAGVAEVVVGSLLFRGTVSIILLVCALDHVINADPRRGEISERIYNKDT